MGRKEVLDKSSSQEKSRSIDMVPVKIDMEERSMNERKRNLIIL